MTLTVGQTYRDESANSTYLILSLDDDSVTYNCNGMINTVSRERWNECDADGTVTPAPTYTTDPNAVTRVVWYIASESVCDYDEHGQPIDGPHDDDRMYEAICHLQSRAIAEYPTCNGDVYVASGGFENQMAGSSPRCETADYSIYEPFYDDMTALEDQAISHAFKQYPTPQAEPDMWELYGDPNNQ